MDVACIEGPDGLVCKLIDAPLRGVQQAAPAWSARSGPTFGQIPKDFLTTYEPAQKS
jgi:hypothetical protein